jgi:phenylacetate-CoA ligase
MSLEELRAWQLERLQGLIWHAYENVPFYHDLYRRLQIHPSDIRSLKDFQSLPFLTRDDVNSHLERLVAPSLRHQAVPNSTGGSTGEPMRFYTEHAFDWWDNALELRGRGWYGVNNGDRIAYVWGAERDFHYRDWRARLRARILRERYLNAFRMSDEAMQSYAEMLTRWKPAMFRAYASALSLFAQYVRNNDIAGIFPRMIETTAEKVSLPQRELLEDVFQCKVADWYSARELGTIGYQCPSGGLHVCETRYLEIVANDQPLQPGQMGEVVITSTHQKAMPFIRYKIGDMATYDPNVCSCGRGLPVLREVVGRLQEFLVTSRGHFVHGGYFPHTLRQWPQIRAYQVYQADQRHLELRLVCENKRDTGWLDALDEELHTSFGEDMNIVFKLVDRIELTSSGKHRAVISEVRPEFAGGSWRGNGSMAPRRSCQQTWGSSESDSGKSLGDDHQ